MAEPAIDDVGLADTGFQADQAGLDLGDHPAVDHALLDQVAALVGSQTPDQAAWFILVEEYARRVGEEDQLVSLERLCDGRGGGVGVDVQEPAFFLLVLGQRGKYGHDAGQAEVLDRRDVDRVDLADATQVDPALRPVLQPQLLAVEALVSLVVQPRGPAAELVDVTLDIGVD